MFVLSLVFFFGAFVFGISIPRTFEDGIANGIIAIILCLACLLLAVFFLRKRKRKAAKPAAASSRPIPEAPAKPAPDPDAEERARRRSEFLSSKYEEFNSALSAIPRAEVCVSEIKATRNAPSDMPEIKYSNITKRTNIDGLFLLIVLDTETTGLTPRGNDIIEVSAIRFDPGFVSVSCFTTLCKARKPVPSEASAVNNITDSMIEDKPFFSEIAASFTEYISGCNIAGHNLPFDLKFLYCCGVDLPEGVKYFDTLKLAQHTLKCSRSKEWDGDAGRSVAVEEYDVEDYKLETLCDYYGIFRNNAHRSLSDCLATAKVFERLIQDKQS